MFLNLLFSRLKNFYYKNMVNDHPTLKEVYKFNRVTKEELLEICNISSAYFEQYALNKETVGTNEKFFLVMVLDILGFLNSHKYQAIAVEDINIYNEAKHDFGERCLEIHNKLMDVNGVYDMVNIVCNSNSYFHGDVIRFTEGIIKNLNRIDILIFDTLENISLKLDTLFAKLDKDGDAYHYVFREDNKQQYEISFKGTKFFLNVVDLSNYDTVYDIEYFDYTVESLMIHIGTGVLNDKFYSMFELASKYLIPGKDIYRPIFCSFATTNYNYHLALNTIDTNMIIKFFKYSKHYKSKRKLKRFMRMAMMLNAQKFTGQQLLNMTEYLISKGE